MYSNPIGIESKEKLKPLLPAGFTSKIFLKVNIEHRSYPFDKLQQHLKINRIIILYTNGVPLEKESQLRNEFKWQKIFLILQFYVSQ